MPLFEFDTESQSSFDPNAQVLDLCASKDSLTQMEDGDEQILFASAAGETAGAEDMDVDKAEREKRKSTEFVKNKNKSEDNETSQNKRRISEGAHPSLPNHPGETPNLQ
jgi:hypothetical protein